MEEKIDIHNLDSSLEATKVRIKKHLGILASNKMHIENYSEMMAAKGLKKATLRKELYALSFIAQTLKKKKFEKASKEDLIKICAAIERSSWTNATKRAHLVTLKKFYKWLRNMDEKGAYPPEVKWIPTTKKRDQGKLPDDLLTEDEIEAMLQVASTIRDKAFLSTLYETGARIGEILNVRLKHVVFNDFGAYLMLDGKTGMRRVPVVASAPILATYLDTHPKKNEPSSFLFLTNHNNMHSQKGYVPLTYAGASKILKGMAAKAGIHKRVHPHLLRHSSCTRAAKFLTESQMKAYFGWAGGSEMPNIYVHLSGRDIDEGIKKMNGIEIKEAEKVKSSVKNCARCKQRNSPGSKFCTACGMALDMKTILELEDKRKGWDETLNSLFQDKDVTAFLIQKIKEKSLLSS